ncbi:MAG: glycyl-radical enzyme activating protein [Kiritimatiellae bacterium]|nr:glycyl-radical enzyme activating protein [Kiritimatiellia bacterium]
MTGTIFDIQRFSLHDGPGIRTTVFFKGCPLRCLWCHNPESVSPQPVLAFYRDRCVRCGACAKACPNGAHELRDDAHLLHRDRCRACGACAAVCPVRALELVGRNATVADVMAVVARDSAYYAESGGGVTVSGGEPLMQPAFLAALLQACRSKGYHTCVETAGFAQGKAVEALVELADCIFLDYKTGEAEAARNWIGQPCDRILRNLALICNRHTHVHLRCPIVPSVNDTDAHFQAIADLAARYPNIRQVELLPYHDTAKAKYERFGLPNPLTGIAVPDTEVKERWLARLAQLGCRKAVLG